LIKNLSFGKYCLTHFNIVNWKVLFKLKFYTSSPLLLYISNHFFLIPKKMYPAVRGWTLNRAYATHVK